MSSGSTTRTTHRWTRCWRDFGPLTESQRKVGKYFLVVAAVLLLQIARRHDHGALPTTTGAASTGLNLHEFLPFNFLRDVHIQAPIIWIGVALDRRRPVPRPGDRRRPGGTRPGLACRRAVLGDARHRRRRADRQLAGHHGLYRQRLVLVRQPGTVLYPARPVLADRLLPRPADLERAGVPRAMADAARRCGRRRASSGRGASGSRT